MTEKFRKDLRYILNHAKETWRKMRPYRETKKKLLKRFLNEERK